MRIVTGNHTTFLDIIQEYGELCGLLCCIPIIITLIYELQWTSEPPLLYKNIYLTLYSRKGWCFCGVWEMGGETYTKREDFFPYLLPGAREYQRLHPLASSSETTSDRLRVPRSTAILCTLSKTDPVVLITWSPSGYTPVWPEYPDAPSSSCLQIKMWQLTKAHWVTKNEPKIQVICYITIESQSSISLLPGSLWLWIGSNCYGSIYVSNWSLWKLLLLDRNASTPYNCVQPNDYY